MSEEKENDARLKMAASYGRIFAIFSNILRSFKQILRSIHVVTVQGT